MLSFRFTVAIFLAAILASNSHAQKGVADPGEIVVDCTWNSFASLKEKLAICTDSMAGADLLMTGQPTDFDELPVEIDQGMFRLHTAGSIELSGGGSIPSPMFRIRGSAHVTIDGLTIRDCNVQDSTGCFHVENNAALIFDNVDYGDGGRAIYAAEGIAYRRDELQDDNTDPPTAALRIIPRFISITDSTFTNCDSPGPYGCVFIASPFSLTMQTSSFINCDAMSAMGGAVSIRTTSLVEIQNCIFTANTANYGGAVAMDVLSGSTTFENCEFISNTATLVGGAVYGVSGSGNAIFHGCKFESNAASDGYALALSTVKVFIHDSEFTLHPRPAPPIIADPIRRAPPSSPAMPATVKIFGTSTKVSVTMSSIINTPSHQYRFVVSPTSKVVSFQSNFPINTDSSADSYGLIAMVRSIVSYCGYCKRDTMCYDVAFECQNFIPPNTCDSNILENHSLYTSFPTLCPEFEMSEGLNYYDIANLEDLMLYSSMLERTSYAFCILGNIQLPPASTGGGGGGSGGGGGGGGDGSDPHPVEPPGDVAAAKREDNPGEIAFFQPQMSRSFYIYGNGDSAPTIDANDRMFLEAESAASVTLHNLKITNCNGFRRSCAIISAGEVEITGVTFTVSHSSSFSGALEIKDAESVLIRATNFQDVFSGNGAVSLSNVENALFNNVQFEDCVSSHNGGAIYSYNSNIEIVHSSFLRTSVSGFGNPSGNGGAIYAEGSGEDVMLRVASSVFDGTSVNGGDLCGAAICMREIARSYIHDSLFTRIQRDSNIFEEQDAFGGVIDVYSESSEFLFSALRNRFLYNFDSLRFSTFYSETYLTNQNPLNIILFANQGHLETLPDFQGCPLDPHFPHDAVRRDCSDSPQYILSCLEYCERCSEIDFCDPDFDCDSNFIASSSTVAAWSAASASSGSIASASSASIATASIAAASASSASIASASSASIASASSASIAAASASSASIAAASASSASIASASIEHDESVFSALLNSDSTLSASAVSIRSRASAIYQESTSLAEQQSIRELNSSQDKMEGGSSMIPMIAGGAGALLLLLLLLLLFLVRRRRNRNRRNDPLNGSESRNSTTPPHSEMEQAEQQYESVGKYAHIGAMMTNEDLVYSNQMPSTLTKGDIATYDTLQAPQDQLYAGLSPIGGYADPGVVVSTTQYSKAQEIYSDTESSNHPHTVSYATMSN